MSLDRLPSFALLPLGHAQSSTTSSPRLSSIASHNGSQSSFTSAASSNGPKTPSPTLPLNAITGPPTNIVRYDAMNHPPDLYYAQHLSAGQPSAPQTVTSSAMGHYHQQPPPMLQSNHGQYSNPAPYSYGYANGLTSPPSAPPSVSNGMAAPQNVLPLPGGVPSQNSLQQPYAHFDSTGQQPPPGMKPRVTATLWEDEGSLCFQVEARGICVARREDNHMINGTKLLNVAGMTRGRRDGILKSEKIRHVVKIGPMHLKGVWIPYERALEFANKEKITELLYPLFVHNIGSLLYHPANQNRTNQVMAAADRRKQDQGQQMRTSSSHGLPSIHHQQQSAMAQVPGNQPTLASHSSLARPGLERAHTFPTPPTSASSVINGMGASEGFNWHSQGINGQQATTPPGTSLQSLQSYPSSAHGGYDSQRQMYTAPSTQQSPYQSTANSSQDRLYGQAGSYPKHDMAPPLSRPATTGILADHSQAKSNGVIPSEQAAPQQPGDEEGEHEQETEYTHDSGSYDPTRASYNYSAPSALPSDSSNMPPEMTGSPNHPPASGRATPRTAAQPQSYYQHGGYTPPRVQQSSNLYNVMSNDRPTTNGATTGDVYAPAGEMPGSMNNGYAPRPVLNGVSAGVKRGRDDDEVTNNVGSVDLKRRKTMMETSVPAPVYDAMNQSASAIGAPPRR
ncbi:hypothetical protein MY4038_008106 [Beauveria bassiana]|uniref:Cell pattern formation-associated protein STUA n=1 Tax=Beauveria bassiana TaxID=176275 RepID=A0A2N6NK37_BEABA|nr:Cell pattern formation-associated protein STUA [Beauveria bassiana]